MLPYSTPKAGFKTPAHSKYIYMKKPPRRQRKSHCQQHSFPQWATVAGLSDRGTEKGCAVNIVHIVRSESLMTQRMCCDQTLFGDNTAQLSTAVVTRDLWKKGNIILTASYRPKWFQMWRFISCDSLSEAKRCE